MKDLLVPISFCLWQCLESVRLSVSIYQRFSNKFVIFFLKYLTATSDAVHPKWQFCKISDKTWQKNGFFLFQEPIATSKETPMTWNLYFKNHFKVFADFFSSSYLYCWIYFRKLHQNPKIWKRKLEILLVLHGRP